MGLYQYDSTEDKLNLVAGSTNFSDAPVGAIFPFGGTDIPVSFLLCDGSAVSRTDYEDLFNVIGTAFGTGDGSTTFNLPDLRGEFLRGAGTNSHSGQGNGGAVGEHQDATKLPNIYLSANATLIVTPDKNSLFNQADASTGESTGYKGVAATSAGGDHISVNLTTRPTNTSVNYIIKAKQIGMPTDFASAVGDIVVDKNTYSTSETIVGKWIDGKPVYQRTIAVTSPNTTPETNVSIAELGFTNIDKIFIISPSYIYLYINNMNQHVPITLGWGSGDLGIIPATDNLHNGYLVWKVGNSAWTSKDGYVTLMYTKTTD